MKKIVSLMLTALIAVQYLVAQVADGIKYLNYGKNASAKAALEKAYASDSKDPQTIYWLGQAYLATDGSTPVTAAQLQQTKSLYQKGLNEIGSNPLLLVGMGQVEILEGGDLNSAKQKFEQAITATTATRGRNKGKPDPDILTAIGRANAQAPTGKGDNVYAIDKLKQAATIDPKNAEIFVNMGINYLKMGGENGGEAVKAFQQAAAIDPQNAFPLYRIGKIYQSQNNKDLFEDYFNKAIAADPEFPLAYHALYSYYSAKDVNRAKDYLDKFISKADKDPKNEVFVAEYLFRSGSNAESVAKLKQAEASIGGADKFPAIYYLYALNYDRMGDSVQAKTNLEKYFANPASEIKPEDYELAVKVFSKFPGSESQAVSYLEKAIASDTSKVNKLQYMEQAASLFGKAKMFSQQLEWLEKAQAFKGGTPDEYAYYKLTSTAYSAKDYVKAAEYAKGYLTAFPDKPQPYQYLTFSAKGMNEDSVNPLTLQYIEYLDSIYTVKDKEKYKKDIFLNQYYLITTYYQKMLTSLKNDPEFKITTDGQKTALVDEYLAVAQKVVDILDSMIAAYPDAADDNNKWAQTVKSDIQKRIDYYSKPPAKKGSGSGTTGATGANAATSGNKSK
jgi:tetratricopeptide (TPR) repeat protein